MQHPTNKPFGLVVPAKAKDQRTGQQPVVSAAVASLFPEDGSDDDESKSPVTLATAKPTTSVSNSDWLVSAMHEQALQEDPSVFDYDASIDSQDSQGRRAVHRHSRLAASSNQNASDAQTESGPRVPQYVHGLLAKAEERRIESELIRIRNMKRKAHANTDETGEGDAFVTEAYRQRLQELDEKAAQLKARQAGEDDGDVLKRKDMSSFYLHLMNRNVSFGGAKRSRPDATDVNAFAASVSTKSASETSLDDKQTEEESHSLSQTTSIADSDDTPLANEEPIVFGPRRPNAR